MRALDDPRCDRNRLGNGDTLIPLVERLRRREREMHLAERCRRQPIVAALVEHETCVDDIGTVLERGDDLLGGGHLRHAGGTDEADGLDTRQPGPAEAVDQLGAHRRLEDEGVVLKPVAGGDVADGDAAQITPSSRNAASSDSESPRRSP